MIKVIAIDFGGVYFTWNFKTYIYQLSKLTNVPQGIVRKGLSLKLRDLHVKKVSERDYWHTFCKIIGKKVNYKILKKITQNQFRPIEPVIQLMKKLRRRYKIVLFSNQTVWLDELNKKYKFYKNFDLLLSSHIVKVQKPDEEIYRLLMNKTRAKPEEIIIIDDLKENIQTAKKMGINAIFFKNVKQLKKELLSFGINVE